MYQSICARQNIVRERDNMFTKERERDGQKEKEIEREKDMGEKTHLHRLLGEDGAHLQIVPEMVREVEPAHAVLRHILHVDDHLNVDMFFFN